MMRFMNSNLSLPALPQATSMPPPSRSPETPEPAETVIRPARGWQLLNLRELWQFRDLLYFLVWRDVKVRYKQTVLGVAWSILQPGLMMVVFTIFFSQIAGLPSGGLPYPVFVLAGLLPWIFFSSALGNAANSVIGSERLITKVYFPRLAIPFAAAGASVVDFAIAFVLLLVVMAVFLVPPGLGLLLAPLIFLLILLAALGFGTLLAALNVAYRDVRYVIPYLLQVWVFATPTVYMQVSDDAAPGLMNVLFALNPMTGLIAAFRGAVLGTPIDWGHLAISTISVVVIFVIGCLYFRKLEDSFADVL